MTFEKKEGLCGHILNYVFTWYKLFPVKVLDQIEHKLPVSPDIFKATERLRGHMKKLYIFQLNYLS